MGTRRNLRERNSTLIRTSLKITDHYMKYCFPFIIAIVVCIFKTVISTRVDLDYILRRHGIIPDVIDTAPEFAVKVFYKRNESLRMGFKVDPALMQHVPRVEWPTEAGVFYTLLMIDPDVPVRKNPADAERQHWVVGNIPRDDPRLGETITSYMGPISPQKSGLHRNTFLVYSQNSPINFTEPRNAFNNRSGIRWRYKFSSRKFAEKYNLTLHAVNFVRTGWPLYDFKKRNESSRPPEDPIRAHFAPRPEVLEI